MSTAETPQDEVSHVPTDWLARGFLLAMLMACAVALSPNNVDPDIWGHVQYAEDAFADGHLHTTTTHSYTAEGYRWINHENLSELGLALGYRWLGPHGMILAKCMLGLAMMGLMIQAARRQSVSMPVACGFLLLVATTLTAFWAMRPQISSYLFLALMVVLLNHVFRDWATTYRAHARWLWLAPPLFALWANSHGAFVAGVCLFIAYLGCRSLELLWHQGRLAWPQIAHFAAVAMVSAAMTLATPYGINLLLWLLDSLRHSRPEITEWAAPAVSDPFFVPMVLLITVSAISWTFSAKKRDWTHLVLLVLCVWQALLHSRHLALLAVLSGFWTPLHVQSLIAAVRKKPSSSPANTEAGASDSLWGPRLIGAGLCMALALLVFKLADRLGDFPVERDNYPVAALQYMAENDLHGKLVVSFNWAQYAIASLSPQTRVAFDGRFRTCYPQEVIDMHFDFLQGDVPGKRFRSPASGPIDPHRVLHHLSPDLVLIDRRFDHSVKAMKTQDTFALLYQDSVSQVWGRRTVFDTPGSERYLAEDQRRVTEAAMSGSVTWPALPTRPVGEPIVIGNIAQADSPVRRIQPFLRIQRDH